MNQIQFPMIDPFVMSLEPKQQALKVLEEASELVEAVKTCDPNQEPLYEFADVLQALGNLAALMGWDKWKIAMAYQNVKQNNIERGRYEV